MLQCQKEAADRREAQKRSSSPTVLSQTKAASLTSEDVTVNGDHLLCKFERVNYYNGISTVPPELYYRSNIDTVKYELPVPGKQNCFEVPVKTVEGVFGKPIASVWPQVAPLIVALFKKTGVKYS